jgi:hypothetical protein
MHHPIQSSSESYGDQKMLLAEILGISRNFQELVEISVTLAGNLHRLHETSYENHKWFKIGL